MAPAYELHGTSRIGAIRHGAHIGEKTISLYAPMKNELTPPPSKKSCKTAYDAVVGHSTWRANTKESVAESALNVQLLHLALLRHGNGSR